MKEGWKKSDDDGQMDEEERERDRQTDTAVGNRESRRPRCRGNPGYL